MLDGWYEVECTDVLMVVDWTSALGYGFLRGKNQSGMYISMQAMEDVMKKPFLLVTEDSCFEDSADIIALLYC